MVSLWPWRGEASAADFEKILSSLATKIQKTSARNDKLRQSSRKVKVMWTLYTSFAYILAALILTLVTGWRTWGAVEYTAVAGGPLVIYGVRKGLTAYYDYRISKTQKYLESLHKERDDTIEKLKTATKYNSTQQLLEKYGSPQSSPKQSAPSGNKRKQGGGQQGQPNQQPQRTNLPPPPTANIVRPPGLPAPQPSTPQRIPSAGLAPIPDDTQQYPASDPPPAGAEFAPNAFTASSTYSAEPRWYDRLFDALLGEDESSARNRIVLICQSCKLVNGQAPPGTKSLEDLGKWRCGGCGSWNGVENEATKIVQKIKEQEEQSQQQDTADEAEEIEAESAQDDKAQDAAEQEDGGGSEGSSVELVEKTEEVPPVKAKSNRLRRRKI